jgi:hypothetical protein
MRRMWRRSSWRGHRGVRADSAAHSGYRALQVLGARRLYDPRGARRDWRARLMRFCAGRQGLAQETALPRRSRGAAEVPLLINRLSQGNGLAEFRTDC